jgi:hypothetical protein
VKKGTTPAGRHWAQPGVGRGFQTGLKGKSYAIATVTRAGFRKSMERREIYKQLVALWQFILTRPDLSFLVSPLGEGYAGWTKEEMNTVWEHLVAKHGLPSNIHFVGRGQGNNTT